MQVQLSNISKRYMSDWIFRDISLDLAPNTAYAILGPNGSGKSTLMKILSGHLTPTKGHIRFSATDIAIDIDQVYRNISYAAPYIELIEELSLVETIHFHQKFIPFYPAVNADTIVNLLGFDKAKHKLVRHFSSGMKQRLKLALALCSDTTLLLLDEPTTNLDKQGEAWYRDLLNTYGKNRTVVIATNVEEDYAFFCSQSIQILDYKLKK